MKRWAIHVIWAGGGVEYVRSGTWPESPIVIFASQAQAEMMAQAARTGLDEALSINVVEAPDA